MDDPLPNLRAAVRYLLPPTPMAKRNRRLLIFIVSVVPLLFLCNGLYQLLFRLNAPYPLAFPLGFWLTYSLLGIPVIVLLHRLELWRLRKAHGTNLDRLLNLQERLDSGRLMAETSPSALFALEEVAGTWARLWQGIEDEKLAQQVNGALIEVLTDDPPSLVRITDLQELLTELHREVRSSAGGQGTSGSLDTLRSSLSTLREKRVAEEELTRDTLRP